MTTPKEEISTWDVIRKNPVRLEKVERFMNGLESWRSDPNMYEYLTIIAQPLLPSSSKPPEAHLTLTVVDEHSYEFAAGDGVSALQELEDGRRIAFDYQGVRYKMIVPTDVKVGCTLRVGIGIQSGLEASVNPVWRSPNEDECSRAAPFNRMNAIGEWSNLARAERVDFFADLIEKLGMKAESEWLASILPEKGNRSEEWTLGLSMKLWDRLMHYDDRYDSEVAKIRARCTYGKRGQAIARGLHLTTAEHTAIMIESHKEGEHAAWIFNQMILNRGIDITGGYGFTFVVRNQDRSVRMEYSGKEFCYNNEISDGLPSTPAYTDPSTFRGFVIEFLRTLFLTEPSDELIKGSINGLRAGVSQLFHGYGWELTIFGDGSWAGVYKKD